MAEGRVIDYRYSAAHPSEWVEGNIQRSIWTGSVKNDQRYEIAAHRCEKCGYLKFYATRQATASSSPYG
jgi:predicted nucleic-acid-binding Zn-ribbon protein